MSKTKVALLGAGFIADIHIESYHRFVPDAEVVAVYTRDSRKPPPSPASTALPNGTTIWKRRSRSPAATWWTSGCPTSCTIAPCWRRPGRQARDHREAAGAEPGRGGRDDRRLPVGRAQVDVRRGTLFRAQVRAGPQAGQGRRRRQDLPDAAVREAQRAAQRLVLRHPTNPAAGPSWTWAVTGSPGSAGCWAGGRRRCPCTPTCSAA